MMKTAPLLVGALGGITPNLLTLAVQLTAKSAELPGLTYLIGLLIFAGLGAVIAYAWEEGNLKKAFYLGVGLPSLIQLNVANLGATPQHPAASQATVQSTAGAQLFPVANAQTSATQSNATGEQSQALNRKLVLIPGEISKAPYYQVVFINEKISDETMERYSFVPFVPRGRIELAVPDLANCAMIQVSSDSFGGRICWPYEPNVVRTVRLDVKEKFWSGFFRSLGAIDVGGYNITLTPVTSD